VQEWGDALACCEIDESWPIHRLRDAAGELVLGRGIETRARGQQKQSRLPIPTALPGHGPYDVVLARCDLPIVIFWLAEHVPLFTRQHVVVSAPNMLLGSSVGFS
jgi:hypothetical protein